MKKKRLIPVLLLQNGILVQSRNFKEFQSLGSPVTNVKRLSEWCSDELIFLDISEKKKYDLKRDDTNFNIQNSIENIINEISKFTFMPITVGGNIFDLKKIEKLLKNGADKVSINTAAHENIKFIKEASSEFGSQCIVVSIDVKKEKDQYIMYHSKGKKRSSYRFLEFLDLIHHHGAGEILINSIDRDGLCKGFDINLIKMTQENSSIPVICMGGAGKYEDFYEVVKKTDVDAVAAANFFQYKDQSVYYTKKFLNDHNLNFRPPNLIDIN